MESREGAAVDVVGVEQFNPFTDFLVAFSHNWVVDGDEVKEATEMGHRRPVLRGRED